MTASTCPSPETLSAFADQELAPADAQVVQMHLATCDRCREEVLDWIGVEERFGNPAAGCLESELLVAYSEGGLTEAERIPATAHLAACTHCRREVEAMRAAADLAPVAAPTVVARVPWREHIANLLAPFARPGPLLSAVTATALVIIALTQLIPRNELSAPVGARHAVPRQDQAPTAEEHLAGLQQERLREEDALGGGSELKDKFPGSEMPPPAAPVLAPAPEFAKKAQPKAGTAAKQEAKPATAPGGQTAANETKRRPATDEAAGATLMSRGLQGAAKADVSRTPGVLTGRAAPADDSPIIVRFGPAELQARVEERRGWTLVELTERRHVWVRSDELNAMMPSVRPPVVQHLE